MPLIASSLTRLPIQISEISRFIDNFLCTFLDFLFGLRLEVGLFPAKAVDRCKKELCVTVLACDRLYVATV